MMRADRKPSASSDFTASPDETNGGPLCVRERIAPMPPRGVAPIITTRPPGRRTRASSRTAATRSSARIVPNRPSVSSTTARSNAPSSNGRRVGGAFARACGGRLVGHAGRRASRQANLDGDRAETSAVGAAHVQQPIAHLHARHADDERMGILAFQKHGSQKLSAFSSQLTALQLTADSRRLRAI
jgi:hypothetical protein